MQQLDTNFRFQTSNKKGNSKHRAFFLSSQGEKSALSFEFSVKGYKFALRLLQVKLIT